MFILWFIVAVALVKTFVFGYLQFTELGLLSLIDFSMYNNKQMCNMYNILRTMACLTWNWVIGF